MQSEKWHKQKILEHGSGTSKDQPHCDLPTFLLSPVKMSVANFEKS